MTHIKGHKPSRILCEVQRTSSIHVEHRYDHYLEWFIKSFAMTEESPEVLMLHVTSIMNTIDAALAKELIVSLFVAMFLFLIKFRLKIIIGTNFN